MTYAEACGEKPIDWLQRLSQEHVTAEEWPRWCNDAHNWSVCPVANLDASILRHPRMGLFGLNNGIPFDIELGRLGAVFAELFCRRDNATALIVYHQINEVGSRLLKEMNL